MTTLFTTIIAIVAAFIFAVIVNTVICSSDSMDEASEIISLSASNNFLEI